MVGLLRFLENGSARDVSSIVACQSAIRPELELDANHIEPLVTNSAPGAQNHATDPLYLEYGNANHNFTRTHVVILFILRCLSDIIDHQLFGDQSIAD